MKFFLLIYEKNFISNFRRATELYLAIILYDDSLQSDFLEFQYQQATIIIIKKKKNIIIHEKQVKLLMYREQTYCQFQNGISLSY